MNCIGYFGFDRSDVMRYVEKAIQLPPVLFTECREVFQSRAEQAYTPAVPRTGRAGDLVKWAGTFSHGKKNVSPTGKSLLATTVLYIHDGYVAKQEFVTAEGGVGVAAVLGLVMTRGLSLKDRGLLETFLYPL